MNRLARFRYEHASQIWARRPSQHRTSFTAVERQDRFPLKRDRDKGKPGESRGRKATRLRRTAEPPVRYASRAAERVFGGESHASPRSEWRDHLGRAVARRNRLWREGPQ